MSNNIKEAFDCITATPELRERTARAVAQAAVRRRTFPLSHPMRLAAVTACLAILLLLGGYRLYMTPVATISVDINPSIELSINRFDRIVGTRAFNEDGRAVLAAVDLQNMRYTDALSVLLGSDALSGYLSEDADISITVLGDSEAHSEEILNCVRTEPYAQKENVYCGSGHHEDVAAAHAAGLSLGKYEAYLILHELDSTITPEDVREVSMRDIRLWIEALGGSAPDSEHSTDTEHDTGTENHTSQSHGSNGHSHGNGHK